MARPVSLELPGRTDTDLMDSHCSMGKEVLSGGRKEGQQVPSMKDRAKAKRRALAARNVNA